jgi:glutathione S-transferase
MKLYYAPRTRATRPRWMLEELGVPYNLVRVSIEAPMFGIRVPTLADGDVLLTGSGAICAYLADKFLDRELAPRPRAPERGPYLQWLYYGATALDPPVLDASFATDREDPAALAKAKSTFSQRVHVLDAALEGRPYLMGDAFMAVDVVVGSILHGAMTLGLLAERSKLGEYVARLTEREAYRCAGAD